MCRLFPIIAEIPLRKLYFHNLGGVRTMERVRDMLVVCVLFAIALTSSFAKATDADVLATVRQKFEAFNRHDTTAIERLYAPDAVLHSPDYPSLSGNKPIADTYRNLF